MPNLTSPSVIRDLCRRYGFTLSKGYGQHFLINPGICPKICDAAGIGTGDFVLEIGPGFGTLTRELAARARRVVAVEVDPRLPPVLEETLAGLNNVEVVAGDVMKLDLAALIRDRLGGRASVCANLPYNLTTPILMRLLEERLPLDGITVMVQREAAARIAARPGTRGAGAVTLAAAYYATPRLCFHVGAGSFFPPPRVTSSVLTLTPRPAPPLAAWPGRERRLFRLVRAGFGQRRKTLANAVSAGLGIGKQPVEAALAAAGLPPTVRPEQLTLGQFIALEAALWPEPPGGAAGAPGAGALSF